MSILDAGAVSTIVGFVIGVIGIVLVVIDGRHFFHHFKRLNDSNDIVFPDN